MEDETNSRVPRPRTPSLSSSKKNKNHLNECKGTVRDYAIKAWDQLSELECFPGPLQFTVVYLCRESPADLDNIIKPLQDALIGLAYQDDTAISDVDCHRRFLSNPLDLAQLPAMLQKGVLAGEESVYIRVKAADRLEDYL